MCVLSALTPLLASSAAPVLVPLANATAVAGTAGATTGGGLFGTSFLSSLGLGSAGTASLLDSTLFAGGRSYLGMRRGNELAAQMEESANRAFALE